MQSQEYIALLQVLQRSINCLADQDRNTRKTGLIALEKELSKTNKHNQIKLLTSTNLSKNLLHTLNDPIEMNRQLTLNLLQKLLKKAQLKKQQSQPIIQALVFRINNTPFPQKSQDLRQKIITLLKDCLIFHEAFLFNIAQLSSALAKCLSDPKAEIKNKTCELINELSKDMKGIIGKYSAAMTKSLAQNLKNNKYVVRRNTLITISKLLITQGAGGNFEHIQICLKSALSDSKVEVRKSALQCTAHLIKYMAPKYLKQYEAVLVSFMLVGLSDQSSQIVQISIKLLEQCGQSIKEMEGEQMQMKE